VQKSQGRVLVQLEVLFLCKEYEEGFECNLQICDDVNSIYVYVYVLCKDPPSRRARRRAGFSQVYIKSRKSFSVAHKLDAE
jgi:hypothetical protein